MTTRETHAEEFVSIISGYRRDCLDEFRSSHIGEVESEYERMSAGPLSRFLIWAQFPTYNARRDAAKVVLYEHLREVRSVLSLEEEQDLKGALEQGSLVERLYASFIPDRIISDHDAPETRPPGR